jgi:hypothetical protein
MMLSKFVRAVVRRFNLALPRNEAVRDTRLEHGEVELEKTDDEARIKTYKGRLSDA